MNFPFSFQTVMCLMKKQNKLDKKILILPLFLFVFSPKYIMYSMIISLSIVFLLSTTTIIIKCEKNDTDDSINFDLSNKQNIELYFKLKRKQQLTAVQTLLSYDRYEKQYQMVDKLFEKIFHMIDESQKIIHDSDYIIGDLLPLNQTKIVHNILQVIDNCAFVANIVLKLPDISRRLLNNGKYDWEKSYRWCFNFTIQSNMVDDISIKMFNLAAQQLNIVEKEEDFLNPYEKKNQKRPSSPNSIKDSSNNKKKNSKTKLPKGPRMSRIEL